MGARRLKRGAGDGRLTLRRSPLRIRFTGAHFPLRSRSDEADGVSRFPAICPDSLAQVGFTADLIGTIQKV